MKTYLLTAVGIIFFTVIVSFIMPTGKLKRSCNFVLRIICIAVLIQPVGKLFNIGKTNSTLSVDYDYITSVYSKSQSLALEEKLKTDLGVSCSCNVKILFEEDGLREDGVQVVGNFVDLEEVERITEYLKNLGYINITVNEEGA